MTIAGIFAGRLRTDLRYLQSNVDIVRSGLQSTPRCLHFMTRSVVSSTEAFPEPVGISGQCWYTSQPTPTRSRSKASVQRITGRFIEPPPLVVARAYASPRSHPRLKACLLR